MAIKKGTGITINIPFTYIIGEEGVISEKVLNTIQDCKNEVIAEINAGILGKVMLEVVAIK